MVRKTLATAHRQASASFWCDAVYSGGPILNGIRRFSLFAMLLGAAVTAVYVAGLIGRPKRVLLRMGWIRSWCWPWRRGACLWLLYRLRSSP